jgi:predicted acyl esterase
VSTDMIIERDVAIPMDDGIALRADLFRPTRNAPVPVIMTLGPYGKGVKYQQGYAAQWQWLIGTHPEVLDGSTGSYLTWETVDPERWVPNGYAVIRVDSRGAGRSPGLLDLFSPGEVRDYYLAIEWAARQPWCNGKVGLCGISYYAINQWLVASLQPPHLAAMVIWEGAADHYRDITHHGGILSNAFLESWYPRQVLSVQHGRGSKGPQDPWMGEPATGPEQLSEEQLATNRVDYISAIRQHPLDDAFHRARSADFARITVPLLSAANWAGFGLHERGNFEGFLEAASSQKWLEAHPGRHEEYFYLPYGLDLQKRFLDHFLKGEDNGWDQVPPALLTIRYPDRFELREEQEWPLARTNWTRLYLDTHTLALTWERPTEVATASFEALGEGLTLLSPPLESPLEITGPLSATLFISSSTSDADLFVTFRAFDPQDNEVDFQGTVDPHTPLAQGWLRASHRKLDPERSRPYRPYHPHQEVELLEPGVVYQIEIEVWPTSIVLPKSYRLALTVGGRDFERTLVKETNEVWVSRGSGPFLHTDPSDRPAAVFAGTTTIYTGNETESSLLLPLVPSKDT